MNALAERELSPASIAGANKELFQTQAEILKSRKLAAQLATRMKARGHSAFDPRL